MFFSNSCNQTCKKCKNWQEKIEYELIKVDMFILMLAYHHGNWTCEQK